MRGKALFVALLLLSLALITNPGTSQAAEGSRIGGRLVEKLFPLVAVMPLVMYAGAEFAPEPKALEVIVTEWLPSSKELLERISKLARA